MAPLKKGAPPTHWIFHHDAASCQAGGHPCCFHRPSDHPLNNAPMHLMSYGSKKIPVIYRVCYHHPNGLAIGHPDPDSIRYLKERYPRSARGLARLDADHMCLCGCCSPPSQDEIDAVVANLMSMRQRATRELA